MNNTTVIRAMRSEDLEAVTQIHIERFPEARSTQLGRPFLRKMYQWFLKHDPEFCFAATLNDQVVGFIVGGHGSYGRSVFRSALPQIIWGFLRRPQLLLRPQIFLLWRSYLKAFFPPSGQDKSQPKTTSDDGMRVGFASVAVTNSAPGSGLYLVLALENAARLKGASLLSHSVLKENVNVIHMYQKLGWQIDATNQHSVHFIKRLK